MSETTGNNVSFWDKVKNSFTKYSMYYILIAIIIFFEITTGGVLLQPLNITNIILQNSYILILAIGMLLCIILGHVDLSVGAIAAFTGGISALLSIQAGLPTIVTVILSLLVGLAIGAFNGFWIAYVKVPAFIATLASQLIFRGLTIIILDGKTLAPFPNSFRLMGSGFLPDFLNISALHGTTLILGGILALFVFYKSYKDSQQLGKEESRTSTWAKAIVTVALVAWFTFSMASYEGFPNVFILLIALIAIYSFVTQRTTIGRRIYATGGKEEAARLSGVNTERVTFFAFTNMGFLAAVAGLIFTARLNAATPTAGEGFELDAIAACYIGGASAYGGSGTITGAIIGGLVMGILNNGMSLMGIGADWQQAIKGAVLLFAVAFDVYNRRKKA